MLVSVEGVTTSWSILSSTVLVLLHYPEYQDRIVEELNTALGGVYNVAVLRNKHEIIKWRVVL